MHIWSLQRRDGAVDLAGMTRDVDDSVERFAGQWRKTISNVAIDPHKVNARRNRPRKTAGGAGYIVAGSTGMGRNRSPEKLAPAEN
ncbi:hypothetical protein TM233_00570 [Bradyrhizobium sp. TM233]|nr:hypothetical protein TM233_00570 [Bradyrhizobium sp. TM233]